MMVCAYISNTNFYIKKAKENIDEQQIISEAAFEAKQAAEQSKLAIDKLKTLKDKKKPAHQEKNRVITYV